MLNREAHYERYRQIVRAFKRRRNKAVINREMRVSYSAVCRTIRRYEREGAATPVSQCNGRRAALEYCGGIDIIRCTYIRYQGDFFNQTFLLLRQSGKRHSQFISGIWGCIQCGTYTSSGCDLNFEGVPIRSGESPWELGGIGLDATEADAK